MGILTHLESDSISAIRQQLGVDLQGPLALPRIVRGEPEPQYLGQNSSVSQGASFPSRHPSPFPSLPGTFPEGLPRGPTEWALALLPALPHSLQTHLPPPRSFFMQPSPCSSRPRDASWLSPLQGPFLCLPEVTVTWHGSRRFLLLC